MEDRVKMGFLPTRRNVFSKEDALKYKSLIRNKIENYNIDIVDIEDINNEGLLSDNADDIKKVIYKFKNENVDAIFVPHCNFGTEDAVAKVAKEINKPLLLWGPRDEAPLDDGMRLRDTQCGLFATGKILRRFNVPFSYLVNSYLDDLSFERGFKNFISVAYVVKKFNSLKILQISTRPEGFWTMIYNEGELLERFGIQITPVTLKDVEQKTLSVEKEDGTELKTTIEFIKSKFDCTEVSDLDVKRVAAFKVALNRLIKEKDCSAVAIQCWTALQVSLGIMPCLVNGLLTDEGIPVTCETDVHGAISAVIAQAASMNSAVPFFADLTIRHPENENGELLFHCGNFPPSLCSNDDKPKFKHHFLFESHAPGTAEFEIKGGDISIVRFDGDHGEYSLLLGKAKGIKGPYTRGTYLWVEVNDWPMWEEKLVKGPYVHHCVGIHHDVIPVLYEACNFIPGLKADPIDPTEQEIKEFLRGR